MLSIETQIQSGRLVCPQSHDPLTIKGDRLETAVSPQRSYPYPNGVPILLPPSQQQAYLTQEQGNMAAEYGTAEAVSAEKVAKKQPALSLSKRPFPLKQRTLQFANKLFANDYRSEPSRQAFKQTIENQPDDALCLAVGGGPHHVHPKLVNLNIGRFPNVHVVGDAYQLPYADNSVDAIHCEAVLEHLEFPNEAVAEMFRVLRVGGQIMAATPFMQHFHAYPNHFQNFTEIGHRRLFERAGFETLSSGVCVGPTFAISGLVVRYLYEYVPIPGLSHFLAGYGALWALLLRPLDKWLNRSPKAHLLASTTYAHVIKK